MNLWPPMPPSPLGEAIAEVMGGLPDERLSAIREHIRRHTGTGNPMTDVEPTRENP